MRRADWERFAPNPAYFGIWSPVAAGRRKARPGSPRPLHADRFVDQEPLTFGRLPAVVLPDSDAVGTTLPRIALLI